MKKLLFVLALAATVALSSFSAGAQTRKVDSPMCISVRGGVMGNVYDNFKSYLNHYRSFDLLTTGFAVDGMYDFSSLFAVRVSLAMGKNAGSCNSQEAGGGFYPYIFRSFNAFADAMVYFGMPHDAFSSRIYGGLGYAYTFDLVEDKNGVTSWPHPWESLTGQKLPHTQEPNDVFGFRVGYLGEWHITPEIGFLIDACSEFYTDTYDCLRPTLEDHNVYRGYAGFPFDIRLCLSLGIAYHF